MKVSIQTIEADLEEHADLHVHELDSQIRRLAVYIKNDRFRSVSFTFHQGDTICPVQSGDLYYIEAADDRLTAHTKTETYETRKRLYELEQQLPANFIRISKAVIINLEKVRHYKPMFNGMMLVTFDNEAAVYISRRYLKEVRSRILEVHNETDRREPQSGNTIQ